MNPPTYELKEEKDSDGKELRAGRNHYRFLQTLKASMIRLSSMMTTLRTERVSTFLRKKKRTSLMTVRILRKQVIMKKKTQTNF